MNKFYEERWELDGTLIAIQTHVGQVAPSTEYIKPTFINGHWIFEHPFGGLPWMSREGQTMKHYYINIEEDGMYKGEEGRKAYEENSGSIRREDLEEALEDFKEKIWQENSTEQPYYQQGWVCPKCQGVNSPSTSRCPCVPLPPVQVTC